MDFGNLHRYEQLFRIFRLCRLLLSLAVKLFRKESMLAIPKFPPADLGTHA